VQSKKANFDASHELEELLLEDNPLKAKARKQNRDINSLSNEMRQMEEQCVVTRVNYAEGTLLITRTGLRFTTSVRCAAAHITPKTSKLSQR
jgi:hypothetical protein